MVAPTSSHHLYFRLLGAPRVFLGSDELTAFRTAKHQALLFFLAIAGGSQRRATLADLLWQDAGERQAQASLRAALYNLRQLVGEHLIVTRQTVALPRATQASSDVVQFDSLLKRTGDPDADIVQLQAAVSLYAGDFLAGFHVTSAPQFELWAALERARLHDAMAHTLLALIDWHTKAGDSVSALDLANRLLSLDPASEAGHRLKMDLLARMGRRSAALAQFEICTRALREDLDVSPAPETTALYELILAGKYGPHDAGPAVAASLQPQPVAAAAAPSPASQGGEQAARQAPQVDYGEMPMRGAFFGREHDMDQLARWLAVDQCSLVVVAGIGGVGKTTLAAEVLARMAAAPPQRAPAAPFDLLIWRSLVNAPALPELLNSVLDTMVSHWPGPLPNTLNDQMTLLFKELERRRCLLVLDNAESILAAGVRTGQFRLGYEDYGQLIERMARGRHRSCLLLTTRELPKGVRRLEEDLPAVRILSLAGLASDPGGALLHARGLEASEAALAMLVERYSGNPLALKLAADTVRDLFGGDLGAFLSDETPVFDDIRDVLDQQFGRLSELEREIVTWLAVEREPVPLQTLWDDLAHPPSRADFLETARSLQRGSLVERVSDSPSEGRLRLGLPNVVTDYVTDRVLEAFSHAFASEQFDGWRRHALVKAQSKEYVQESQRRLLLEPLARRLTTQWGLPGAVERLKALIAKLQHDGAGRHGYVAANCLHLLLHLQADLRGVDLSGLALWQADLRRGSLAGVDLRNSDLQGCTFSDTFGVLKTVAISPDGRFVAAGGSDGRVFTWQLAGYQPHLVLQGHKQAIGSAAFSPDGAVLASGGYDGLVCIWDAATGMLRDTLRRHTDTIVTVAFSPDGAALATGGADRQIVVWDWQRRAVCACLPEPGWFNGLAFSPDGHILASASDDRTVRLWDWRGGSLLHALAGHAGKVQAVAFSPDGVTLASGGEDNRVLLWTLAEPGAPRVLGEHAGWILALAFSPDGRQLASAGADRTVRLWDIPTGQVRRILRGHTGWSSAVAFAPDGAVVASAGYDQTVRLWGSETGHALHTLHGYVRRIDFVRFSTDGALLASSSLGGAVHLWDVDAGRLLRTLSGSGAAVRALAISPDNRFLAGGSDDYQVYLWEIPSGQLRRVLAGHRDAVRSAAFTADGRYLVTGGHDKTLRIWEAATGQLHLAAPDAGIGFQTAPALARNGRQLAYGATDHTVRLMDLESGDRLLELPLAAETALSVAFDDQGQWLACGSETGVVRLWDVRQLRAGAPALPRFTLQVTKHPVQQVAFSADARYLLCGGADETAHIVDLAEQRVCYSAASGPGAYGAALLDGRQGLLTASPEHNVLVHDLTRGAVRQTLAGHTAQVMCLDANARRSLAASSSADGTIRLWNLRTGDCQAVLEPLLPYAGMNIAGATGLTPAQRATLIALGAVDN